MERKECPEANIKWESKEQLCRSTRGTRPGSGPHAAAPASGLFCTRNSVCISRAAATGPSRAAACGNTHHRAAGNLVLSVWAAAAGAACRRAPDAGGKPATWPPGMLVQGDTVTTSSTPGPQVTSGGEKEGTQVCVPALRPAVPTSNGHGRQPLFHPMKRVTMPSPRGQGMRRPSWVFDPSPSSLARGTQPQLAVAREGALARLFMDPTGRGS